MRRKFNGRGRKVTRIRARIRDMDGEITRNLGRIREKGRRMGWKIRRKGRKITRIRARIREKGREITRNLARIRVLTRKRL